MQRNKVADRSLVLLELGRSNGRLPPPPDRRAKLHAQSRGDREGNGRGRALSPSAWRAVHLDPYGAANEIQFGLQAWDDSAAPASRTQRESVNLPARTILIAAGTHPNTVLGPRRPPLVTLDEKHFQAIDEEGNPVSPERLSKPESPHVLMDILPDGRAMSFFGDLHPSFSRQRCEGNGQRERKGTQLFHAFLPGR